MKKWDDMEPGEDRIEVFDSLAEARARFGENYGGYVFRLTRDQVEALLQGRVVAFDKMRDGDRNRAVERSFLLRSGKMRDNGIIRGIRQFFSARVFKRKIPARQTVWRESLWNHRERFRGLSIFREV